MFVCLTFYISESESHSVMSDSLWPHGLYSPWNSPGQNTGVGSLSLSTWIESRSPVLQADSLPSEPQGKFKNTGVGSLSLLQGSSQPRNQTWVSGIAGGFFTNWATREVLHFYLQLNLLKYFMVWGGRNIYLSYKDISLNPKM